FVILATGATLFKAGHHEVQTARDAALALRPLAGPFAEVLFALGMIGAGVLAVPVLTGSAAYGVGEVLGWRRGLDQKPNRAPNFYALIIISTVVGVLINFIVFNPISALFWAAVINGFVAPPMLVILMLVSSNRKIMGDRVNGLRLNFLGWLTTAVMFAAAIGF